MGIFHMSEKYLSMELINSLNCHCDFFIETRIQHDCALVHIRVDVMTRPGLRVKRNEV